MWEMIILAYWEVLILNGAQNGSQGWGYASNPIFTSIIYAIANFLNCFQMLTPITILHVYHYIVNLFPNGWILVSCSNTHQFDSFTCIFRTELHIETFSLSYLDSRQATMVELCISIKCWYLLICNSIKFKPFIGGWQ
jgi:hypothetical protein